MAITILDQANVPQGPFTREQVAQKLAAGEFTPASLAHAEGFAQWTPLRDVLARFDAVPGLTVPPVPAPGYSYAATMQPPGHLVYAGFWLRFVAIIIDGIILAIPVMIVSTFVGGIVGFTFGTSHPGETFGLFDRRGGINPSFVFLELGVTAFSLVVRWLYFSLQESSAAQATIGKRVMGLKVTNLEGQRIGFAQATGRFFAKIISGMILFIGYIMAGFTERKQALHDMLAGTLVVRS